MLRLSRAWDFMGLGSRGTYFAYVFRVWWVSGFPDFGA